MSVVSFVIGAIAAVIGVVLVAVGIPVKEFSFGNTLILAGTITIVSGAIVFALGAVIAQLHRIADMLGARPATRNARAMEPFDQAWTRLGQAPGRIPFPPRPKASPAEPHEAEPNFADAPDSEEPDHVAPALRNPEEQAFANAETDEAPLMPHPAPQPASRAIPDVPEIGRPAPPLGVNGSGAAAERPTALGNRWRPNAPPPRAPQPNYFDAMWPAEQRPAKLINADERPARAEPALREGGMRESIMRESVVREPAEPKHAEAAPVAPASDMRTIPILKSGVIDGMGYTLYVDGSIEAELPNGTLRFASIGELREHLEKSA
jgi:hypothetical protein